MVNEKVLFVCKYNVLRSKIGEAYLKKVRKDIEVRSAGVIAGGSELYENEKRILKSEGFVFSIGSNCLSKSLIDWADKIIIVADNVPKKIFEDKNSENSKKVIVWEIKDSFLGASDETVKEIINQITSKVDKVFGGKNGK